MPFRDDFLFDPQKLKIKNPPISPTQIFGRPGVPRLRNHTVSGKSWSSRLAAEGGKAKKPRLSRNSEVCWPRHPRPPKNHLAKKHFAIPSRSGTPDGIVLLTSFQRNPEVVLWPSGFLVTWGTKAPKPHMFQKIIVFWHCRRRHGQKNTRFWKMSGFWASAPQASKNKYVAKKHFGIPVFCIMVLMGG